MGLYIVIGVVAVIVIAVAAYYIARFMKGRLKLELLSNAADSGQPLRGKIALEAKKPINGLLKVSLIGREKRKKRSLSSSDNDSYEWVEVYRQDKILEETREFPAGFTKNYDFEIIAPTAAEARSGGAMLRQAADQMGDSVMGGIAKIAAAGVDLMQGRIKWHIEARLDADGVDLYDKERCQVNLRD